MLQAATIDVLARTIKATIPDFHGGLMVFVIISYPLDRLMT